MIAAHVSIHDEMSTCRLSIQGDVATLQSSCAYSFPNGFFLGVEIGGQVGGIGGGRWKWWQRHDVKVVLAVSALAVDGVAIGANAIGG